MENITISKLVDITQATQLLKMYSSAIAKKFLDLSGVHPVMVLPRRRKCKVQPNQKFYYDMDTIIKLRDEAMREYFQKERKK